MAKIALLIGVSEYEHGLNPLPGAVKDVDAMHQVLVNPDMGGFPQANVSLLKNPDRQTMAEAIEQLFAGRRKDDLVLLFFSGHGKKDDTGRLYLATRNTRNTIEGDLIRASALPAYFIHESMERSRSRRQVVILDSCFSGAFAEGLAAKDDGSINIREQLGGEGRAVLTSSSSTQYSFEQKGSDLSIYTRFLIEGITTGEADLDEDEVISIDELHEYASNKVREFQPAMKPEIFAIREGFKIQLTTVPQGNPHEKYRKIVKRYGKRGKLSIVSQSILDAWRTKLALSVDEAEALTKEVLEPYRREFEQKIQRYEQAYTKVVQGKETVDDVTRQELQELQKTLELRNEDTVPIEAKVIAKIKAYQQNLQAYQEAFNEELRQNCPLTEAKRSQMRLLAQQMELANVDITSIEARITAEVETYRRNLEQYQQIFTAAVRQEYPISDTKRSELKSQQQNLGLTEVDIAQVEARITTQIKTYQQKLQQYEQAFIDATESKHYPNESTRKQLRQTWQTLELSEADVAKLEAQINTQIEAYQANLRQYEEEFVKAIKQQYPLSEAKQRELRQKQQALTITEEDVASIETRLKTELEEHLNNLQQYEQALASAMKYEQPLTDETREDLRQLQKVLELNNEDIALIEEKITKVQRLGEENYKNKLQQYEQEFFKTVEQEYPLSKHAREQINILGQSLGLRNEDIRQIEQPILATKYQEKQKKEEIQRKKEQEAEIARQLELQKRIEREEYENKLQQYKQEFSRLIQRKYPLDEDLRNGLKSFQVSLGLRTKDVEQIESLIIVVKENQLQEAERQKREAKKYQQETISSKNLPRQDNRILYTQKARPSKKARHRRILVLTVLSSCMIWNSIFNIMVLFWIGVFLLLIMFTSSSTYYKEDEDSIYWIIDEDIANWRRAFFWFGGLSGGLMLIILGLTGLFFVSPMITVFAYVVYTTSICIGRW